MRIGLLSDIHGNLHAFQAVLDFMREQSVDLVMNAGDSVCYGAFSNEVVVMLQHEGIPTVAGNYDAALAWNWPRAGRKPSSPQNEPIKIAALEWTREHATPATIRYVRHLPWDMRFVLNETRIVVVHAGPDHLDQWTTPEQPETLDRMCDAYPADFIITGHTHQPQVLSHRGCVLINPGAVGRALDGDVRASCAILDTGSGETELHRIAYDHAAAVEAIRTTSMPDEVARLVEAGARRIEEVNAS